VIFVVASGGAAAPIEMAVVINSSAAKVTQPGFVAFGRHWGTLRLAAGRGQTVTVIVYYVGGSGCSAVSAATGAVPVARIAPGDRLCFRRTSPSANLTLVGEIPSAARVFVHSAVDGTRALNDDIHTGSTVEALDIQYAAPDCAASDAANLTVRWLETGERFNFAPVSARSELGVHIPDNFTRLHLESEKKQRTIALALSSLNSRLSCLGSADR
jgi:hypothetical protein